MADAINNHDPLGGEAGPAPKKRTRVQFSCTACRYRKLKCDRIYPCTNCKKRDGAASCTFVGRGPRGKAQHGRSSPTLVQDRLQHLENLVMSLAQKQKPDQFVDFNAGPDANAATGSYDTPPSTNGRDVHGRSPQDTGTLVVKDEGTSYFDSANWRAILEEINGVKDYIGVYDDDSDHEGAEEDVDGDTSPALLLGMSRPISKDELLVDIPPRSIADRLVARFFKTTEPSLIAVHGPTFQREYEQFWKNPQDMSFTWIAYLYAIFALSVSHYHRSEEPLPLNMVDPISIWKTFRKRSAQGLMQSNYLTPGRYKPEALFLYSLTEFYRSQDAQAGVSYLFGILIRLTMRMGYHRDPNHYPSLSPWEGEMRRRLWALVCQLDILISFQVGLPRTIQPWQYDTEQPSNLHDTDFDEATMELPPSRPDSERTACAYTRSKSRIMKVFGQIVDLAFSREQASYDEILSIDRRLQEAHDQLPHFLQYQPIGQCIADPTELIMRRYTLELLYQKSRVVLHRRYMAEPHSKYSYSRSVCLIAARETLRHHSDVYNESLPGGQLYAERFFMSSLQNTDFMLSAMILCLEISQENERENALMGPQERGDLLCLLETTYRIFKETRHRSVDTQRGYAALKIMLGRVKGSPASSDEQNKQIDDKLAFQPVPASIDQQQYQMYPSVGGNLQDAVNSSSDAPLLSSLGLIEDMLNTPAQMDWRLYDSRISGFGGPDQDGVWLPDVDAVPPGMDDFVSFPSGV